MIVKSAEKDVSNTFHSHGFAPCSADCGSNLDYNGFLFICNGIPYFFGVIALAQGAHRTVGDALAAEGTVCIGDLAVAFDIDGGSGTGTGHIPDTQSLHFIADLDAAHALDALFRVADEREILIPWSMFYTLFKRKVDDV